jgi:hypothetical protein
MQTVSSIEKQEEIYRFLSDKTSVFYLWKKVGKTHDFLETQICVDIHLARDSLIGPKIEGAVNSASAASTYDKLK